MRRAKEVLLGDAVYVRASRAVHAKLLRPRGVSARLGRRGAVVRGSLALLLALLLALPLALPARAADFAALLDSFAVFLALLLAELHKLIQIIFFILRCIYFFNWLRS